MVLDIIELMKREMLRRNYSRQTIKAYVFCMKKFLIFYHKEPRKFTKYDVRDYLNYLCEKGKSASTLNVYLQALKFGLEQILNKRFFINLPFSKTPKKLPEVLSKEEVIRVFNNIKNKKHSLMIRLMYSAGLRVSELVNLRVRDLNIDKGFGWVRKGKGNKDRLFIISKKLNHELFCFIKKNNMSSDLFLFVNSKGNHLSTRTVYEVVKQSVMRTGIDRSIHPHTFRHSFATHLIENGYSVNNVQSLMGHNNIDTTMIYVHMLNPELINVKSPYDDLIL